MKKLDVTEKEGASLALQAGSSVCEVAKLVGVHYSTISRLRSGLIRDGRSFELAKNGGARILHERAERKLVRLITSGECSTSVCGVLTGTR